MTAPDIGRPLVDHARTELELLGEYREEPAFAAAITAAVAAFASYGHSGFSADHGRRLLCGLLARDNLTPLTSDPAEWVDRTAVSDLPPGHTLWQNVRNPKAFTSDRAATYWLAGNDGLTYYPTHDHTTAPAAAHTAAAQEGTTP